MTNQTTLKQSIEFEGPEVYGGCLVKLKISPADPDSGIVYETPKGSVRAQYTNAKASHFSLMLESKNARVLNVEHLTATLYAMNVDNARVRVERQPSRGYKFMESWGLATDIEVVPILPGREFQICQRIAEVGLEEQPKPRTYLSLDSQFRSPKLSVNPRAQEGLSMAAFIDYPGVIHQRHFARIDPETYLNELSFSRPCTKPNQIPSWMPRPILDQILKAVYPSFGIGHGFSLDDFFLYTKSRDKWLVQERCQSEVAAHSIVDRLGLFAMLGGRYKGVHIESCFSNHASDVEVAHQLFPKLKQSQSAGRVVATADSA